MTAKPAVRFRCTDGEIELTPEQAAVLEPYCTPEDSFIYTQNEFQELLQEVLAVESLGAQPNPTAPPPKPANTVPDSGAWREWRDRIKEALLQNAAALLHEWLPEGRVDKDRYAVGSLSGEKGKSLTVWLNKGNWKDWANDIDKGGDLISLYARLRHIEYRDARDELAAKFGIAKPVRKSAQDWQPIVPVPDDAPRDERGWPLLNFQPPIPGEWVLTNFYNDRDGRLIYCRGRWNCYDGGKEFRPISYCQSRSSQRAWQFIEQPKPRPLYGLDRLAARPAAPVGIFEGESTADAAQQLLPEWCCVSFGSSKAPKNLDWTPLLNRDTRQVIWRDNDRDGLKAQADIASQLKGRVEVVDMDPAWREHWDIADGLAEGWDAARTLAYLEAHSHPVNLETELCATSSPDFTHDSMALHFTEQYGADLRYIAMWGHWYKWQGNAWKRDETLHVFDLIRDFCRNQAPLAETKEIKRMLKDARTVTSVERLTQSDRRHAATVYQWDANPMLLNTPAGIVDLETGKLRTGRREDYCTKITAVGPASEPNCPNWQKFLKRVLVEDELVQFLQRMAGYILTGQINEHALFFFYGLGSNGKSTVVNTLLGIMLDYATTTTTEVFMVQRNEHHPTEIADLQGARLVAATEIEQGQSWAEARISHLTGGEPIKARFMRQDFFQYLPQFKLLISGNHQPSLYGVTEAIRRRFHLIPFTVTIPKKDRDTNFAKNQLHPEWPGILRWMLDGCREWQKQGLSPKFPLRCIESA